MRISYHLLLLLLVSQGVQANQAPQDEPIDTVFFTAFVHACQTNSASPLCANVTMADWDTVFSSKVSRSTILSRVNNFYKWLNGEPETLPNITISSTTRFDAQNEPSSNDTQQELTFKNAIKAHAIDPNQKALVQCTQQINDHGTIITCKATCNLQAFKQKMDSYNQ